MNFLITDVGTTGTNRKKKKGSSVLYTRVNSKWIQDLNFERRKGPTIKELKTTRQTPLQPQVKKVFITTMQNLETIEEKNIKFNYIKLRAF